MTLQRLFQVFTLLILLFSPIGYSGYVHASIDMDTQPNVTTTVNPSNINVDETALVSVSLNNIPQAGYSGSEFTCMYNVNSLEVDNIIVTQLFGANAITVINGPQNGFFILAIAGSQGNKATTSGTAFTFRVKGVRPGQIGIQCSARIPTGDNRGLLILPSTTALLKIIGNSSTPSPATPTVLPPACRKVEFIADINVPPGTVMFSGSTFRKTWRFMNTGTCPWSNSDQIVFYGGDLMTSFMSVDLPVAVQVGQTVDISLDMTAPLQPGSYHGYWMFRTKNGEIFGIGPQGNQAFLVDINVSSATSTHASPTNTPTATFTTPTFSPTPSTTPNGPTATLPPGIFFDFAANACSATWYSGAGQLPCPGTEGDIRGFMRKLDHPLLETGGIDPRPGLLLAPQYINNGYIQGIYPAFKVRSGDRFRATIGCEGNATNCYVVFRLDYALAGSNTLQTFWAFVEKNDDNNYSADIDLSPLAGQDIKFILTILSTGSPLDDRALWINPVIHGVDTDRNTSTPGQTATSTPTPPTVITTPTNTPTITITASPTDGPGTIPIIGRVLASKPAIVSLYNLNHHLVNAVAADADGNFSFIVVAGTYSVDATSDGFLSARSNFTITSDTHNMSMIALPSGDIDGNNIIDQFDALTIGMNYNASFPTVADLNNDGIINLLDLQLLAANYQKSGPIPWQ